MRFTAEQARRWAQERYDIEVGLDAMMYDIRTKANDGALEASYGIGDRVKPELDALIERLSVLGFSCSMNAQGTLNVRWGATLRCVSDPDTRGVRAIGSAPGKVAGPDPAL